MVHLSDEGFLLNSVDWGIKCLLFCSKPSKSLNEFSAAETSRDYKSRFFSKYLRRSRRVGVEGGVGLRK